MKYVFLISFLVLAALSAVAFVITPAPDATGRKTIVWASDDNPRRRNQIITFNELHPAFDLKLDALNQDIDKVITQSLAGVGPDAFDANRDKLDLLAEAGLLFDITDQLKARGITLDQFWPLSQQSMAIDGRIYGVPFNVGADAIWFHKDIFDSEGIPYPPESGWKWDDFVKVAQKLTKRDASGRVIRYGVMGLTFNDILLTNGGRILTPDGRRCVVDSPRAVDALQKWLDLQLKYRVSPSASEEASLSTQGGWNSGVLTLFKEKRVAMAAGGRWWLCTLRDYREPDGRFILNLGVAEKPVMRIRRSMGVSRITFVNSTSPHPDRAIEFLMHECSDIHADQINRDADAMPGRIAAATRPSYDFDPSGGRDGGNSPVWRNLAGTAVSMELSPYITYRQVEDLVNRQIELVRSGVKTPQQALTDAAKRVNDQIQQNVSREPNLRARFENHDTRAVFGNFPDAPPDRAADGGAP